MCYPCVRHTCLPLTPVQTLPQGRREKGADDIYQALSARLRNWPVTSGTFLET